MKILVATDGSPYGEAAVQAAAEHSWPPASEIRVLTVMERPAIYGPIMILSRFCAEGYEAAEGVAAGAAASLPSGEQKISHTVREAITAADGIIDEAKEWGADLILVGTHGRQGIAHSLLGSVAERIAAYAPCSVEIVRKPDGS